MWIGYYSLGHVLLLDSWNNRQINAERSCFKKGITQIAVPILETINYEQEMTTVLLRRYIQHQHTV